MTGNTSLGLRKRNKNSYIKTRDNSALFDEGSYFAYIGYESFSACPNLQGRATCHYNKIHRLRCILKTVMNLTKINMYDDLTHSGESCFRIART